MLGWLRSKIGPTFDPRAVCGDPDRVHIARMIESPKTATQKKRKLQESARSRLIETLKRGPRHE